MRALAAAVVVAGLGATAGIAAASPSPNDVVGCVLGGGGGTAPGSLPVVPLNQPNVQVGGDSCSFTAAGPVAYAGAGDYTVTVVHDTGTKDADNNEIYTTTTYTGSGSAVQPGAPVSDGQTAAVAGDQVTAAIDATGNGGLLAVGVNPCVELSGSPCPTPPSS
jgi:hypothetical protein